MTIAFAGGGLVLGSGCDVALCLDVADASVSSPVQCVTAMFVVL